MRAAVVAGAFVVVGALLGAGGTWVVQERATQVQLDAAEQRESRSDRREAYLQLIGDLTNFAHLVDIAVAKRGERDTDSHEGAAALDAALRDVIQALARARLVADRRGPRPSMMRVPCSRWHTRGLTRSSTSHSRAMTRAFESAVPTSSSLWWTDSASICGPHSSSQGSATERLT